MVGLNTCDVRFNMKWVAQVWDNSKETWPPIPRTTKKGRRWKHLGDGEPEPPEGSTLWLCGVAQHVIPATSKGKKYYFCSNTQEADSHLLSLTVIVSIFVVVINTDCKS